MQPNLVTIAVLGAVQMPAVAALVWLRAPADRLLSGSAPRAWAAALLISACGWLLLALQPHYPGAPLLAAACTLQLIALATFTIITRAVLGAIRRQSVLFAVALLASVAVFACAWGTRHQASGLRVFAAAWAALALLQAWPLRAACSRNGDPVQRALLAILAVCTLAALWLLLDPAAIDPLQPAASATISGRIAVAAMALTPTLLSLGFVQLYAARDMRRRLLLAHIDPTTGALNRRAIVHHSRQLFATSMRHGRGLALLMLQIDHFERLQILLGRACERRVLPPTYACLQSVLRTEDIVGRSDADTFVLLLPESGPSGARDAAERLREAVARLRIRRSRRVLRLTASIGIATMLPGDRDLQPMLRRATRALAAARRAGCNRVSTHAPQFRDMQDNAPPSLPGNEVRQ